MCFAAGRMFASRNSSALPGSTSIGSVSTGITRSPIPGSDLSYALALLNREGDGVVVSSIWSREETRTYGKSVAKFTTVQDASKEELEAIERARNGA